MRDPDKSVNYSPSVAEPQQQPHCINIIPKKMYEDEDLLTPAEVCKIIGGVTPKTLRDWNNNHRHKKILAPIRITYRVVRYRYANVKEFISRCSAIY